MKNYLFRKGCVLLISTFCLLNYSCKSNDEEVPLEADLILEEIQMERGSETIIMEFSEDGRPILETNKSFIYNANNQLIESVDSAGGWFFPTNYSYNNDLLVTYDYTVIGSSGGTSQVHTEISYEDTSVTRTAFYEGETVFLPYTAPGDKVEFKFLRVGEQKEIVVEVVSRLHER